MYTTIQIEKGQILKPGGDRHVDIKKTTSMITLK